MGFSMSLAVVLCVLFLNCGLEVHGDPGWYYGWRISNDRMRGGLFPNNLVEIDDDVTLRVKGYIDAGTCDKPVATTNCETDATSYFKTFIYNGQRVIISSQIPDHDAEQDALNPNPSKRCEHWQYISVPIDPSKAATSAKTELGPAGFAVTGAVFFNDLANPDGDLAIYKEGDSLDSCWGHSTKDGAYHYHSNIACENAGAATGADNADACQLIGYMNDGVPLYGFCKDRKGKQITSCYKLTADASPKSMTHVSGTYDNLGTNQSDYEYDTANFAAGRCHLDDGNGMIHPRTGKYSYFATEEYPYVPILYYGDSGSSKPCSAD